ncbi:hypothetical protein D1867_01520 [Acidianus infernus]|uniref:Uncharacterized protein n=1 Tax=Acidianus infernus TaxID=12915 RepID=A0A6A9Q9S1_ACIIN|nr:hypothetical protein [Acidianus infernus]MUM63952.1 hypothetical protein [Acidianus infernus]
MALSELSNITSQIFGNINIQTVPISEILIVTGIVIASIILFAAFIYGMFKLAKALPSMSVKNFMLFMLVIAAVLIIIGILIP